MTIYERLKDDYLVYSGDSYKKIIQEIVNYSTSKNSGTIKVLELGVGSGAFTRFFRI